jgi:large subunit ribosomal protein L25
MKNRLSLKAEKREVLGRKVKKLRQEGFIPANIYGRDIKSQSIKVFKPDFDKVFKEAGQTQVINLEIDNEERPVLIHNLQRDPLLGNVIHVDFLQIDLRQKVTASIPVVGVGESPVEKQGLGTVVFYLDEIEIEALPTDLPEKVEVDLSKLVEVDQQVLVKDLNFDESKVLLKVSPEEIVVKVEPVKEESPEEPASTEGESVAEASASGEKNDEVQDQASSEGNQ